MNSLKDNFSKSWPEIEEILRSDRIPEAIRDRLKKLLQKDGDTAYIADPLKSLGVSIEELVRLMGFCMWQVQPSSTRVLHDVAPRPNRTALNPREMKLAAQRIRTLANHLDYVIPTLNLMGATSRTDNGRIYLTEGKRYRELPNLLRDLARECAAFEIDKKLGRTKDDRPPATARVFTIIVQQRRPETTENKCFAALAPAVSFVLGREINPESIEKSVERFLHETRLYNKRRRLAAKSKA